MEIAMIILGVAGIAMSFLESTTIAALLLGFLGLAIAGTDFYYKNKNYEPLTKYTALGLVFGVVAIGASLFNILVTF